MNGDDIYENGSILINNNRIEKSKLGKLLLMMMLRLWT